MGRYGASPVHDKTRGAVPSRVLPHVLRCRRRPTLPRPLGRSTIGAVRLNDRVRNGNGCGPDALVASELLILQASVVSISPPHATGVAHGGHGSVCGARRRWPRMDEGVGCRAGMVQTLARDRCCPSRVERGGQAARAMRTATLGVCCQTSTGGLVTGWSPPALQVPRGRPRGRGAVISGTASHLDAFSGYPYRSSLPGAAVGTTAGTRADRPTRSSRTRVRAPQSSTAHDGYRPNCLTTF